MSHRLVICQLTVGKLINACCANVMTDEITTSFATNVEYALPAHSLVCCSLLLATSYPFHSQMKFGKIVQFRVHYDC